MKKIVYGLSIAAVLVFTACSPKVDRSIVPAAGPAPVIQIGQAQQMQLENGLKLIVVENHKLPRVSYNITLDIDPVAEGEKAGYVSMAGDLMASGTQTRTKAQIDEAVDYIGASLSSSSQGVSGTCLKKHSENFLELMSDVLLHPSFPQDELDKAKKITKSGLASNKTDPGSISSNLVALTNYGREHPYGEIVTETSVDKITRDDLQRYYDKNFRPNVAYLVVVGDITFEEASRQAQKYFSTWKQANVMARPYKQPVAPTANRVAFAPIPGAVQSVIDITYPIDLQPGTQDEIVASVLNNILGGSGFNTRLMQNLREGKAYTYGAYSTIDPDEVVGAFSAGASVRNEVTDSAIVQFLYEMEKLVNEPVADTTLKTVKNIMTGSFARSLERPQTIANFALNVEKYNLPKDFYQTYLQKLNAVTAADVQALAKRVIKPANANITVVGNKEVAEKLARFAGSGKVEMFNYDGTPYSEMKPAPAGMIAQDVLNMYINAIGGATNLANVKSFERSGTVAVGPMQMQVNVKVKDMTKMRMNINMGGMDVMTQVLDGSKGYMSQMGQRTELEPGDITDLKMQADMLGELHYGQYGIVPTLLGIDMLDGEEVYVIELKEQDGSVSTDYFSVATGLRVKSVTTQGEGEEAMLTEILFKEYTAKDGIKYVSKMTQAAGPQSMEFNFTEMKINPVLSDKDFIVDDKKSDQPSGSGTGPGNAKPGKNK